MTFEDLTIDVCTIFELDDGSPSMRRIRRNLESWTTIFAPNRFSFGKVCESVRVTGQWDRELYFFPNVSKGPHIIVGEDKLDGAIRCLYKQSIKERVAGHISLSVAADVNHVCLLTLDQRSECIVNVWIGSS